MATEVEAKFACCSPCLDDGRNTVARHYCVDCEIYFCTKCVKCHNAIPLLRKHQINEVHSSNSSDVEDQTSERTTERGSESADSFRCTIHEGRHIDTFCKDHNKVFCGACAVVKHRACATVSMAIAAKEFKSGPDVKKFRDALTENLAQSKQEKEKRSNNLDSILAQKLELIENIDTYEERIIAKIKQLANISRREIRSKYEEHKTALETDIEALDVVIATTEGNIDKLKHTDDEQLFVVVKTSEEVTKDGEMLIQAMTKDHKERAIIFHWDETLSEARVLGMKSLGRLDRCYDIETKEDSFVEEYQTTFDASVNLQQSGESTAHILDICLMNSNDILLTDYQNKKLKRFTSKFSSYLHFKDAILLSGQPVAVCKIDEHEAAVRISGRLRTAVCIISVGETMKVVSSFGLSGDGGMAYDAGTGEIFACEENKVGVYSKTGDRIRSYDRDIHGWPMFLACKRIAFSMDGTYVYVTDKKGVTVFDKSANLKMKVSLPGVNDVWPLCLLPGDICLLGSLESGLLFQVDKNGKQVGHPINTKSSRLINTFCAVYDRQHSRLLVGGYPSVMSIYTMKAK